MGFKPYRTFIELPQGIVDNLGEAMIYLMLMPETNELSISVVPAEERYRISYQSASSWGPELIWIHPRDLKPPVPG